MQPDKQPVHLSRRKLGIVGLAVAGVAAFVVVTGILSREQSDAHLREWTDDQAIPTVAVANPIAKPPNATLTLPGRLEAYYRAPIFARVSGYLKNWYVDIGAEVKTGQLLAEIDAPDLDQQLLQARADLANAEAASKLSAATLQRRRTLLASNFVSLQEIDERTADLSSKDAQVKAAQANVDRLQALASYKRVEAPFDGVVTERNTDVGALINGGTGSGSPMFVVSDYNKLRVYVNVPQSYLSVIKIGTTASISVPEYVGRKFPATVESSAEAVDVNSGTTRIQLGLDNKSHALRPGAYADVTLNLTGAKQPLSIPASALIFDKDGLSVATVDSNNKVRFKKVTIARDLGREIELASGISATDRIVTTPPDGVADGDEVRIAGQQDQGGEKKTSEASK